MSSSPRRVIVVTGASAGIGAELSRQLASLPNHALVLAARRQPELEAVQKECEALGTPTRAVVTDVTKKTQVLRLLSEAVAAFGDVHVVVNNAGAGCACPTLQLDEQLVDDILSVNLKSALWGMQAAAAHFTSRQGGGHIVNISSFLGKVPAASVRSIYSASKAALNSLSSNVRMDLAVAGHGDVRLTTVYPGVVSTDFPRIAAIRVAATAPPATGPPPPPPSGYISQTPSECAAVILGVVQSSAGGTGPEVDGIPAEVFTQGDGQRAAALKYQNDVEGWERESVVQMRKAAS